MNGSSKADMPITKRRQDVKPENQYKCGKKCILKEIDNNTYSSCDCKNVTSIQPTTIPSPILSPILNSNNRLINCFTMAFNA